MNAQEAIEHLEFLIEQSEKMKKYFPSKTDSKQIGRYRSLQKDIDAMSIVLESAKKFHNSHKTEVRAENKLLYYDFSSMINPEELDELGIEKGADG